MRRKTYTLHDHLEESVKDQAFRKAWEESEVEYQVARQVITERLRRRIYELKR